MILVVTIVVTTGVAAWTLRQPRIYEATCTIEYDPNPLNPLGDKVDDVANPLGSYWSTQEFFNTQNRVLESRAIAERVVKRLGLNADPTFFGLPDDAPFEPRSVESAANRVRANVTVVPIKDTRLVEVSFEDTSAERAQTLANAIADAYIEKTVEDRMASTVGALDWLGNQLDSLRKELEESELSLHNFKEDHNVLSVSMEDRQNLVASEIQAFNDALTTARMKRIELAARVERIREANLEDPLAVSGSLFAGQEGIESLRTQLRAKLAELDSIKTSLGPNHPRMKALNEEIATLQTHLQKEVDAVVSAAEAELKQVERIENGLRGSLDRAHSAGLELNLREIEYQRLARKRENNAKLYELVLGRTTETDLTRMMQTTHVRMVDRATRPKSPVRPNYTNNLLGGFAGGLLFGLVVAFGLAQLDRRVRTVSQLEGLGMTVLGILPAIGPNKSRRSKAADRQGQGSDGADLIVHTHPMSAAAECARTIRTNLAFMVASRPVQAFVVTSASPREGKTTIATNVAISIAQSGRRVLLVDTDLRRPRLHRAFGIGSARGITSILVGADKLEDVVESSPVPGLDLLPCGPVPPNPAELLHSVGFQQFLKDVVTKYDQVIFDSPPLGAVTDAAVLAPQLGGVLLVVRAGTTTRDALRSALRQLADVGAHVIGAVANGIDLAETAYGTDGYYQYYRRDGYYYGEDEQGGPAAAE